MTTPVQILAFVPRKNIAMAFLAMGLATAIMSFVVWYLVSHPNGIFGARGSGGAWGACAIFFFWLVPYCFIKGRRGPSSRQVWIEDDRLIFYGDDELPISGISGISVGKHKVGVPQIEFLLNDGTEKKVIVHGLSLSAEALAAKLRSICGLPDSPNAIQPQQA